MKIGINNHFKFVRLEPSGTILMLRYQGGPVGTHPVNSTNPK